MSEEDEVLARIVQKRGGQYDRAVKDKYGLIPACIFSYLAQDQLGQRYEPSARLLRSQQSLANELGIPASTLTRNLNVLRDAGLLGYKYHPKHEAYMYRLNMETYLKVREWCERQKRRRRGY